jgi:4-amino-4-deoxy-L-arabinose transferase-like glycosyltransferase
MRAWFEAVRDPVGFAATWDSRELPAVEDRLRKPLSWEVDTRGELFSPGRLAWFWPFAREEPHGHPPFYAWVALLGDVVVPGWMELARARFGTMLAFSLVSGLICAFVARRWGIAAGLVAACAWVLQPNLFALGHYATYDALLSCAWVGCLICLATALETWSSWRGNRARGARLAAWSWTLAFGICWGCAMGTKLTGWLLPVPILVWLAYARPRDGARVFLVGLLVALGTFYVLTPPLWTDPVGRLIAFFRSNLSRAETIPIQVMFLGQVYETPRESLPWYNTIVWTVLVTPVGFLILAGLGVVLSLRRARLDAVPVLIVINWLFLLALRALPHTPGHDGVRQFLPAFGCLAIVAGIGAAWLVERIGRWGVALLAAGCAEGAVSVALLMPVPLSYFSPLVGGLPGATALGMEPTYYWDALDNGALRRLEEITPAGKTVLFAPNSVARFLRAWDRLRVGVYPFEPGEYSWFVVQNRRGALGPTERGLASRLGARRDYVLSEKFGVPLVWAFPAAETEGEFRRTPSGNGASRSR